MAFKNCVLADYFREYLKQHGHSEDHVHDLNLQSNDSFGSLNHIEFDKERDFPCLPQKEVMSFGPSKKPFTLQLKYSNYQSVGESNGFEKKMISHVRELQTQNNKRQKCHFRKTSLKIGAQQGTQIVRENIGLLNAFNH